METLQCNVSTLFIGSLKLTDLAGFNWFQARGLEPIFRGSASSMNKRQSLVKCITRWNLVTRNRDAIYRVSTLFMVYRTDIFTVNRTL